MHVRKYITFFIIVAILNCVSGCMQNGIIVNDEEETAVDSENQPIEANNTETDISVLKTIGKCIKELEEDPETDKTVILVNGQAITKKDIEIQRIYSENLKNTSLKQGINLMIREKVIKAETVRLGVQPSQERIEEYLKQTKKAMAEKVSGTETIFAYIEGMGITQEEYFSILEKQVYDMYQREALWTSVEQSQKYKDYEEYLDFLVEQAEVQILDDEIKKLF